MESKVVNNTIKPETITYEKVKIEQALQLLNKVTVTGIDQSNLICNIFNLLQCSIKPE